MASQAGYDIGLSDAGIRAHLLAGMWGSRPELAADISGPISELIRLFLRTGKSTSNAYPDKQGVLLTGIGGVLNYDGLSLPWKGDPPEDIRRHLDALLTRRILRRGLALVCVVCRDTSFVPVDDLAQTNACKRCGAPNELSLDAWQEPTDEPLWFYDLHPVARDLVRDNGHAPLWLAHYLAQSSSTYADTAEMNLLRPGTRRSIAETDLIAHVDGQVVTAEVKTSNALHTTRKGRIEAAAKRVLWAATIRADEILLATTAEEWETSSIDEMNTAIKQAALNSVWVPGHEPKLRLITKLGTAGVESTYLEQVSSD